MLLLPGRLTVYGVGTCTESRTSASSARIVVSIASASSSSSAVVGSSSVRSRQASGRSLSSGSIEATPLISSFNAACLKIRSSNSVPSTERQRDGLFLSLDEKPVGAKADVVERSRGPVRESRRSTR